MKILCSILLAVCLLTLVQTQAQADNQSRPNIILIMCDDLGYADVGFSGSPDIKTPELDALAVAGTVCTSGYVTHPFCGPSRMGLLSGRYPHKFGGQYNLPPVHAGIDEYNQIGIPKTETLISTVLQDAGYTTGIVGKWHLGEDADYHPNNRGFDEFYGFLGGGHHYFPEHYRGAYERQTKNGRKNINDYFMPLQHNGVETRETEYLTDELSKQAVRFINESSAKKEPFFLYLAYNAPHSPMQAKQADMAAHSHIKNPKRRTIAGMIAAVDRGVGWVANALSKNHQAENTLIVFLSDNGGKPSLGSSNAPFRGTKGDCWEGGFRVPMFFHWPGKVRGGTFDHAVSALDLYPTFASLANARIPSNKQLDGTDLSASIIDNTDPQRGEPIYAMRHRGGFSEVSARQGDWKVVRMGNQPWRLFHISEDPSELNDLAAEQFERVTKLVQSARVWADTHQAPLFFDSINARNAWVRANMPNFNETFQVVTGAPKLSPVGFITDNDVAAPAVDVKATIKVQAATKDGVRLKKGDSTLEQFIAFEKAKWNSKGWNWDRAKVEQQFHETDANGDGIATGLEKKAYWSNRMQGK